MSLEADSISTESNLCSDARGGRCQQEGSAECPGLRVPGRLTQAPPLSVLYLGFLSGDCFAQHSDAETFESHKLKRVPLPSDGE